MRGVALNHLSKPIMPKITKEVECDLFNLYEHYEREEFENASEMAKSVWLQAKQIYADLNKDTPYFLIFMVRPVFERFQTIACTFAICPYKRDTGMKLKDSLVWYCDKPRGVFKLVTDLCDLTPRTSFSETG